MELFITTSKYCTGIYLLGKKRFVSCQTQWPFLIKVKTSHVGWNYKFIEKNI